MISKLWMSVSDDKLDESLIRKSVFNDIYWKFSLLTRFAEQGKSQQPNGIIFNYHDNKTMSEWLDSDSQQQLPWNTVASPNYLKIPQTKPRKKRGSRITTQHDQSLWLNLKWWRQKTFQQILFLWIFQQIGLTTSGQVLCCDFLWNPREILHVWVRADGQSTPPVFFFFVLELKKSVLTTSVLSKIKPWKIWQ